MQTYYDQMMSEKETAQDWKRELAQAEIEQFQALQDTDLGWGDWTA